MCLYNNELSPAGGLLCTRSRAKRFERNCDWFGATVSSGTTGAHTEAEVKGGSDACAIT